jgi:predicted transposase YbfD/YdcC
MDEIIDEIDLTGTTVSIDAIGCQKKLACKITQKNGNYLFALKLNKGC